MGHLSFGGILLVALCIANAYSPRPAVAAETQPAAPASEPEAANVLAKALIAMRQATRAAGDSGSAEATVATDESWPGGFYVKPPHRIVFRFKGNDSRFEGYRPSPASQPAATAPSSQEPQLEYVQLNTHGREITYASLSPTDKGECAIRRFPANDHNEFIGAVNWSYFSLTSIPNYVDHMSSTSLKRPHNVAR